MEKDRSRHLKNLKDKRRYKGNSTKYSKHVPSKATSNLESNWDRYEKENDAEEFQLSSSTDYSVLANAPILRGHHFQFKSDKLAAEEIESKSPIELFTLNLNLLKQSILTVPFYRRVGIAPDYFAENQMKCMNRDAEVNMTKYEQYVKELSEESTRFLPNQDDGIAEETITVAEEKQDFPESPELTEMERDKRKVPAKLENERPDDDLEQWLDDILDD